MFETATYTDCLATESFDGAAGFNFASVSPGYDGTSRAVALRTLLHKVSSTWGLQHEATTQPESAHFHPEGGRYHFSRGRSTGATASGRRGNQFTQLAATDSAADLAPYRPAQLLRATTWTMEREPGTVAPTWEAPLDVDPEFEADALLHWARSDQRVMALVEPVLTQLTAVARPNSSERLVVVGSDPEVCLRLVALATLLMDEATANSLGIALGVEDPWQAGEPIVVVPRQFDGATSLTGSWFVDMDQMSCPPLETSPLARAAARWMPEMDDYDLLELVSLARSWARYVDEELAARSAALITGHADELTSQERRGVGIALVGAMARAGAVDQLEAWDEELCATIDDWPHATEHDFIDRAQSTVGAQAAGLDTMAAHITDATLELMTLDQTYAGAWARTLLAADGWNWPDPPDGADFVQPVMQVASRLHGQDLVDFSRLMARMPQPPGADLLPRTFVELSELARQRFEDFRGLIDWWQGPRLRDTVVASLVEGLDQQREAVIACLVEGRLDALAKDALHAHIEGSEELMQWVHAAQVGRLDPSERVSRLARLPDKTWRVALARTSIPEDAELWVLWLGQHRREKGQSVDPVGEEAARQFKSALPSVSRRELKRLDSLADVLAERGYGKLREDYFRVWEEKPTVLGRFFGSRAEKRDNGRATKER